MSRTLDVLQERRGAVCGGLYEITVLGGTVAGLDGCGNVCDSLDEAPYETFCLKW
jgi:hypothetical protein